MAQAAFKNERYAAIYASVRHAAEHGQPCPTNMTLSVVGDYSSISGPVSALAILEKDGLLRVEKRQRSRVIHFPDGLSTLDEGLDEPHWRDAKRRDAYREKLKADVAELVAEGAAVTNVHRRLDATRAQVLSAWASIKRDLGRQAV